MVTVGDNYVTSREMCSVGVNDKQQCMEAADDRYSHSRCLSFPATATQYANVNKGTKPQLFYGPFSETNRVSWCQKKASSGLYGAREDKRQTY